MTEVDPEPRGRRSFSGWYHNLDEDEFEKRDFYHPFVKYTYTTKYKNDENINSSESIYITEKFTQSLYSWYPV